MSFVELKPESLQENAFELIGQDWLLVTGSKGDKHNAMTASWGGLGIMWGKKVAYLVIRPQRYTKEFIDASDHLTISVFPESMKKMMGYFGSVSGRDEDKIAKSELTLVGQGDQVYYEEARINMICRKLYAQEMKAECFIDKSCDKQWYQEKDYHTMYIVEVKKLLIKE